MASAPTSTGADTWPLASATLARAAQLAPPSLRVVNGKLGVQYSSRAGQFEQYTWLMKVTDTGADQDRALYAACIVRGCTKVPHQTLLAKYPQTSFDMGNMMKHFKSAHFDLLHPDDQRTKVSVAASASAPVGFKMPDEIAQQEEQALLLLGVGYPIAFVDSLPWITFCKNHGLKHTRGARALKARNLVKAQVGGRARPNHRFHDGARRLSDGILRSPRVDLCHRVHARLY